MNLGRNVRVVGRYMISGPIASGGMAVVHLGRLLGPEGFSRTVAVKQLHGHYANDPDFVQMFLDEARLAARVRHPNVISPLDIVAREGELYLVLEYVHGETLQQLLRLAGGAPPLRVVTAIASQTLLGLHAAHEAHDEQGRALDIVHRDVSPPNILVGEDGVARVLDFGIAKATHRAHQTQEGQLKGKLGYMSPEQLRLEPLDRRSDLFATGVVLFELLTGQPLFLTNDPALTVRKILSFEPTPPSTLNPAVPAALDAVVLRALSPHPEHRFASARDMAVAIELAVPPASALEVAAWVDAVAGESLQRRANAVAELESLALEEVARPSPASEPPLGVTRARRASPTRFPSPVALSPASFGSTIPLPVAPTLVDPALASATAPAWAAATPVPGSLANGTPRRRTRKAVALVASALLAIAAGAAVKLGIDGAEPLTVPATPAAAAPIEAPRAGPVRVDSLRPAAVAPPPPALTPTESETHAEAPSAEPRPLESRPRSAKKRRSCDVPFVIDEQGVKRFRPECF